MDRETRELLDSLEKTNARMLTTLSRVLAGDAEKADQRARMVCLAQRETTHAAGFGLDAHCRGACDGGGAAWR